MTHTRKNFNYLTATIEEIVQHFQTSSRQAIYAAQKLHSNNPEMTTKLKQALLQYKIAQLHEKLS